METMQNIKARQVFRNKKTGDLYRVILIGMHSETKGIMVVYRCIEKYPGVKLYTWCRPLELFKQKFEEVT